MPAVPGGGNRRAPDQAGSECSPRRIGIVVSRVGRRQIAIRRSAAHDDCGGVVLWNINYLRVSGNDLYDFFLDHDHLFVVGFQVARRLGLATKTLNGFEHGALIRNYRLTKTDCPVEIATHFFHYVGVVQKGLHRFLPRLVDRQALVAFSLFKESICLHDFQWVGGGRKNDGDQVVRVQRNWCDELVEVN